jgi:hypothetical protein
LQLQIKQQKEQEATKHPSRPAAAPAPAAPAAAAYIGKNIYRHGSTRVDTAYPAGRHRP